VIALAVTYVEKDEVKSLGARWNPDNRTWYINDNVDPEPFNEWRLMTNEEMLIEATNIVNCSDGVYKIKEGELYYFNKMLFGDIGKWILFTSLTSSSFEIFKILCAEVDPAQAKISIFNKFEITDNMMCFYSDLSGKYDLQKKILESLDRLRLLRPDLYKKIKLKNHEDKFAWKMDSQTAEDWSPGGKLDIRLKSVKAGQIIV